MIEAPVALATDLHRATMAVILRLTNGLAVILVNEAEQCLILLAMVLLLVMVVIHRIMNTEIGDIEGSIHLHEVRRLHTITKRLDEVDIPWITGITVDRPGK